MEESNVQYVKTKCELCKCLNMIEEGKRHPSLSIWTNINIKFQKIIMKDAKSIASFCERHRVPLTLIAEIQSVRNFIIEVNGSMDKFERLALKAQMKAGT